MEKIIYPKVGILDILKTFWRAVEPHRWLLFTIVASIVVVNITEVITPLYYKRFFDTVIGATDRGAVGETLIRTIVLIFGLNGIVWLGYRIATFVENRFLTRVTAILRQHAFEYLLHHSYSFFSNNFTGALVQRVNRLARSFDRLSDKIIWNVIPLLVKILGVGVVLYLLRPIVAGVMLGWAFLFILFNYVVSIWKLKYDIRVAEADSRTTGVLADAITNHHSIQLFTNFKGEAGLFRNTTETQARVHKTSLDISAFVEAVQAMLIITIEFAIFYLAIGYWTNNSITVGFFVLLQAYILGLTHRLWEFSRVIRDIYESYADAKEMVEIMTLPHEIKDRKNATKLTVRSGAIAFKNVSFSFNQKRKVFQGLNLDIKPGEKIALVGPSGAGKSTIVKLLLRLHEPSGGAITIDDSDISTVTLDSLRAAIALVPQDTLLFHRTLMDNIRYGRGDASDEEVRRSATLAHCDEFIENLPGGFDTFVGERGIKLSGGERQRVAIARAMLKNAPLLILDEATSSLDSHSEMLIQDALDVLMKGKTVVVIAHRLSTIRKMDRIVVIDEGKIVETGDHETLLLNEGGLYKKLWTLQAGGFMRGGDPDQGDAEESVVSTEAEEDTAKELRKYPSQKHFSEGI